jgi:hypothetical protein
MAKFQVNNVFTITDKLLVFIQGEVIDGKVHIGDYLQLPMNASFGFEGKICAIEFSDTNEGAFICLGLECKSYDEQKIWLEMNIKKGEILEVNANA